MEWHESWRAVRRCAACRSVVEYLRIPRYGCAGLTVFDAACTWLKEEQNARKWKQWLPVEEVTCQVGYYRLQGADLALSCRECPAGFFSSGGAQRSCSACAAGSAVFVRNTPMADSVVAIAHVQCFCGIHRGRIGPAAVECAAGEFQPTSGQSGCMSCDNLGDFYQELPAQTSCTACASNTQRFIGLLSATNSSACQCKAGASFRGYSSPSPHYSTSKTLVTYISFNHYSSLAGFYNPNGRSGEVIIHMRRTLHV